MRKLSWSRIPVLGMAVFGWMWSMDAGAMSFAQDTKPVTAKDGSKPSDEDLNESRFLTEIRQLTFEGKKERRGIFQSRWKGDGLPKRA